MIWWLPVEKFEGAGTVRFGAAKGIRPQALAI
jgi:hypothetical protein